MEHFIILIDSFLWILKILLIGIIAFATGLFCAWFKEKNSNTKRALSELLSYCETIKKKTEIINQKMIDMYILINKHEIDKRQIDRELVKIRKTSKLILLQIKLIDKPTQLQKIIGTETQENTIDNNVPEKNLDLPMECIRLNYMGNSVFRKALKCETVRDVLNVMIVNQRKGLGMYRNLGKVTIKQLEAYFEDLGFLKIENGLYYSNVVHVSSAED